MSVLITGVNMPSFGEGNELIVRVLPNGAVLDEHGIYLNAKAIPVPSHGRLIDLDALFDNAQKRIQDEGMDEDELTAHMNVLEWCFTNESTRLYAPIVIPAEPPKGEVEA